MSTITGTGKSDILNGTLEADSIFGNYGDDIINGISGADTLVGGTGDDTYIVSDLDNVITEQFDEGTDVVISYTNYVSLQENIENLILGSNGFNSGLTGMGNELSNTITGNTEDNYIFDAGGDDYLEGAEGNDILDGGPGNDTLIGGTENDRYYIDSYSDLIIEEAGQGIDRIFSTISYTLGETSNIECLHLSGINKLGIGNSLDNELYGGNGNDTLNGGAGSDQLMGGAGNDVYIVDNSEDYVYEWEGDGIDFVQASADYTLASGAEIEKLTLSGTSLIGKGNDYNNYITGTIGNNTLDGAGGADTLAGLAGNDTYIVDNSADKIIEVGVGIDTVKASANYTISAYIENLELTVSDLIGAGNTLANIITGTTGSDTLDGGLGADSLYGGDGNDTYVIDNLLDKITDTAGTNKVRSSINYSLADNIENLELIGTAITGTGNAFGNTMTGNAGNNKLYGLGGYDVLYGGVGNDVLDAGDGFDDLYGGAGNDSLYGGAGDDDWLYGEEGNDFLDGGTGIDKMWGGSGNDTYYADNSADVVNESVGGGVDIVNSSVNCTLGAGQEIEKLTLTGTTALIGKGNEYNNYITGTTSNNTLDGAVGADTLSGLAGNDTYIIDNSADKVIEAGVGIDTVYTSVDYSLSTNVENLTISTISSREVYGNTLNNSIAGNNGNDIIFGGTGNDTIIGGAGSDYIDGGIGLDSIIGGLGDDTYTIDNIGDKIFENSGEGTDRVYSFITYSLLNNFENLILNGTGNINGTGNVSANAIFGNTGNNLLLGYDGNDVIDAIDGNDTIDGGVGADSMYGGVGNDTYIIDNTGDFVFEYLDEGTLDLVKSSAAFSLNDNIENLTLTGTSAITGKGNALANTITGNNAASTLMGYDGNDIYIVANSNTVISETGGSGIDTAQTSVNHTLAADSGVEILTLTGTALIGVGNDNDNTITGTTGNNTLNGAGGDDTLNGGLGNDTLIGGTGIDSLVGGAGNDIYDVDSILDSVFETATGGVDIMQSSSMDLDLTNYINIENITLVGTSNLIASGDDKNNTIKGNAGSNTLMGNGGNDILDGGAGIDYLNGGAGNDSLLGGEGNDQIFGDTGIDTLIGGNGDDRYCILETVDKITETVTGGNDTADVYNMSYTLSSYVENLILNGTNLKGVGNASANTILGDEGNDTLDGGLGSDTMIGRYSNDLYIVDNIGDVVIEYYGEGIDTIQSSVTLSLNTTLLDPVENLTLTGAAGINGTGNSSDNTIIGNTGNNTLIGNDGNDVLDGKAGADSLVGGNGDDIYTIDNIGDKIIETIADSLIGGIDAVRSSMTHSLGANFENLVLYGSSVINGTGNSGDNVITGNAKNNILVGNGGNDVLDGGKGNDTLTGGVGNDTYVIDSLSDLITVAAETGGNDTIESKINYSLTMISNIENLTLIGSGNISAEGTAGDNVLTGNMGNNTLTGNAGNDILTGSGGRDSLIGGDGNDTYCFSLYSGLDNITDTAGTADLIKFDETVDQNDIAIFMSGSNLLIDFGTTEGKEKITVLSQDTQTIEKVELSDGKFLTADEINSIISQLAANATDAGNITSIQGVKFDMGAMAYIAAQWHS